MRDREGQPAVGGGERDAEGEGERERGRASRPVLGVVPLGRAHRLPLGREVAHLELAEERGHGLGLHGGGPALEPLGGHGHLDELVPCLLATVQVAEAGKDRDELGGQIKADRLLAADSIMCTIMNHMSDLVNP